MPGRIDKEGVLSQVNKALGYQFDSCYSWADMLRDSGLTKAEYKWALDNISYKAYIFTNRGEVNDHQPNCGYTDEG